MYKKTYLSFRFITSQLLYQTNQGDQTNDIFNSITNGKMISYVDDAVFFFNNNKQDLLIKMA